MSSGSCSDFCVFVNVDGFAKLHTSKATIGDLGLISTERGRTYFDKELKTYCRLNTSSHRTSSLQPDIVNNNHVKCHEHNGKGYVIIRTRKLAYSLFTKALKYQANKSDYLLTSPFHENTCKHVLTVVRTQLIDSYT